MCLMILLVYLLLLLLSYTIRICANTMPASYAYAKKTRRTRDGRSVGTVIACIETAPAYTPHPPVIRTYMRRKPRRRLAMVVDNKGFSTQHPAMAFIPGVRLICRWLLFTSFCPSAVQPLEMHGRSDKLTPMRVIRWSDNTYVMYHYAAAALNLWIGYAGT